MSQKIKSPADPQAANAPFIFTLIKKCIHYKIPTDLMDRLNYTDLLYMVVEYDIQSIKDYLRSKERERLDKRGVEVTQISPEQTAAFFKGGN